MAVRQASSMFLNVQVRLQLGILRVDGLGLWIISEGEAAALRAVGVNVPENLLCQG